MGGILMLETGDLSTVRQRWPLKCAHWPIVFFVAWYFVTHMDSFGQIRDIEILCPAVLTQHRI